MQEHLTIQRHIRERREELKSLLHTPTIHFVETAPSVLREMPWIILREHGVSVECIVFLLFQAILPIKFFESHALLSILLPCTSERNRTLLLL